MLSYPKQKKKKKELKWTEKHTSVQLGQTHTPRRANATLISGRQADKVNKEKNRVHCNAHTAEGELCVHTSPGREKTSYSGSADY